MTHSSRYLSCLVVLLSITLSACSVQNKRDVSATQWDFDHQVQFKQSQLSKNSYLLEITPNPKVGFERLSVFLIRKSFSLCQHYNYKLEILQGIEGFDDKRAMPNYIYPSLKAKVLCK
jgi:hypothetical protein